MYSTDLTCRYFPVQLGSDNLKEGFELGSSDTTTSTSALTGSKFNLTEPNVFHPSYPQFRTRCEALHSELQCLAARLLSLLAIALKKPVSFFDHYLTNSLSTLRLLHYPHFPPERHQELICTPHTDSGTLTLLHQDPTGGLEVLSADGTWVPAPYIQGTIVVNIGDLMAKVSGGRWVATFHRVRSTEKKHEDELRGRYCVPFFFEPGLDCVVQSDDGDEVVYGTHVLDKMKGWIESQDEVEDVLLGSADQRSEVEAF